MNSSYHPNARYKNDITEPPLIITQTVVQLPLINKLIIKPRIGAIKKAVELPYDLIKKIIEPGPRIALETLPITDPLVV